MVSNSRVVDWFAAKKFYLRCFLIRRIDSSVGDVKETVEFMLVNCFDFGIFVIFRKTVADTKIL